MKKKGIRVLSLFDGISCARVALERAGIPVETYYASEIEKHPITIAQNNYPDTIQLGDIRAITRKDIAGGIDLLIGGSPCQDLSRAKTDGKGLDGARSSLFYEYLRLLRELKPRYFILENVASMKAVYRDEISRELGVEPIMIDAALVSAQTRKRLFWTNIPGVCQPHDRGILLRDIIEDGFAMDDKARTLTKSYMKGPCVGNIGTHRERTMVAKGPLRLGHLKGNKGSQSTRVYSVDGKSVTLSALGGAKTGLYMKVAGGGRSKEDLLLGFTLEGKLVVREATKRGYALAEEGDSIDMSFPSSKTRRGRVGKKAKNLMTASSIYVFTRDEVRPLTPVECERLQSLPDGYTDGIPKTQRIAACGNAFNVEVVAHVLKHMKV
jgi:site-specific DNA-cytosine methylase